MSKKISELIMANIDDGIGNMLYMRCASLRLFVLQRTINYDEFNYDALYQIFLRCASMPCNSNLIMCESALNGDFLNLTDMRVTVFSDVIKY